MAYSIVAYLINKLSYIDDFLYALIRSPVLPVIICIVLLGISVQGAANAQSRQDPDALSLTANPQWILRGGDMSMITAQLMLNGQPYARPNYPITFSVDNGEIGYLPAVKANVTDEHGQATIILTSANMAGTVNVTAQATDYGSTVTIVSNTVPVHVVNWGTIGGTVFDQNNMPLPNATMTLKYLSGETIRSRENPQLTASNAQTAPVGSFSFYRIPAGQYTLSWSKLDWSGNVMSGSQPVTVSQGTSTAIFNMNRSSLFPAYADAAPGSATLYGYVLDMNKNAVPGANVKLYNTAYNSITDSWDSLGEVAKTITNSSSGMTGFYNFANVPYGTYKVAANREDAAKNDHSYYAIVTLDSGGYCAYIVIPGLVIQVYPPAATTPAPTPASADQNSNNTGGWLSGILGGNSGSTTPGSTDYAEKATVAAAAVAVGTGLSVFGLFFGRIYDGILATMNKAAILMKTNPGNLLPIDTIFNYILGPLRSYINSKLSKILKGVPRKRTPIFLGLSSWELMIIVVASLLLGVAYLVSKKMDLLSITTWFCTLSWAVSCSSCMT